MELAVVKGWVGRVVVAERGRGKCAGAGGRDLSGGSVAMMAVYCGLPEVEVGVAQDIEMLAAAVRD
jgi:hypothetical protein